jgi:alcohol dehydrogenase/L-iditol 2-dehydrogenase
MRALVRYGVEPEEFGVHTVADPAPSAGEVVIRVGACGVCGSDLGPYRRRLHAGANLPRIPGHEFSGAIVAVGPHVDDFRVGDRVTCETAAEICGTCELCRTGNYNLCRRRRGFGFNVDGAFAEYVRAPVRCLHRVPEGVSYQSAALTEPACVAYNAVGVHSRVQPGDVVVVIGSGPIGLMALQSARLFGARTLLVGVSGDEKRLEAAREVGADVVLKSDETDVLPIVLEQTDGLGAALVVDAVGGVPATMELALRLVRPLGQITKVGWFHGALPFSLDALLGKTVRLQGCFSHTWPTWERCLRLMAEGQLRTTPLISHALPLDDWAQAYELSIRREAVKAMICPNGDIE